MDDTSLIVEQYRVFNEAKERFIDRHFQTNRFYFVFAFTLLTACYVFYALSPAIVPMIVTAAFGIAVSILWWLNIDSYQVMIKIKYAKILEYLETKLPEQPFHKEFEETRKLNKAKNMTFPDVQKGFAGLLFFVFLIIFSASVVSALNYKNAVLF